MHCDLDAYESDSKDGEWQENKYSESDGYNAVVKVR